MVSVVRAAIRVVVLTPIALVMYAVYNSPELLVVATTASGGIDVVALLTAVASLPNIHVVAPVAVLVAILLPSLPSTSEMNG